MHPVGAELIKKVSDKEAQHLLSACVEKKAAPTIIVALLDTIIVDSLHLTKDPPKETIKNRMSKIKNKTKNT